jgi:GntR family transcriptional regulator
MSLQPPRARYRQVADDLREAIVRGTYGPGAALPSQPDLARRYGLNQTSISRAIGVLEGEGLVRTEHGRGSYVIDIPPVKRVRRIPPRGEGSGSSFAEEMRKQGLDPDTKLIQAEVVNPPAAVAVHLDLGESEQALIRKRHMFVNGRPVQIASSYIPLSIAGSVDLAFPDTGPTGIYERLAERGHQVARFVEEIESRRPSEEEASFLGISPAQPVLEVTRLVYDRVSRPLEAVINVFPSQLWQLTYEWEGQPRTESSGLPRHSVSVTGVVVRDDGQVLAIKRADDGRWVPPGGVLELGESPQDGVVREVYEETGVRVQPVRLTGVYKNMKLGVVSLAFLCHVIDGDEHTSSEAARVAWLSSSDAVATMPEARAIRITDALRNDGPFVRTHDGNAILG